MDNQKDVCTSDQDTLIYSFGDSDFINQLLNEDNNKNWTTEVYDSVQEMEDVLNNHIREHDKKQLYYKNLAIFYQVLIISLTLLNVATVELVKRYYEDYLIFAVQSGTVLVGFFTAMHFYFSPENMRIGHINAVSNKGSLLSRIDVQMVTPIDQRWDGLHFYEDLINDFNHIDQDSPYISLNRPLSLKNKQE